VQYKVVPLALFAGAIPSVQMTPSVADLDAAGFAIATPEFQTSLLPFLTQVKVFFK
jgi:hypothetical protein